MPTIGTEWPEKIDLTEEVTEKPLPPVQTAKGSYALRRPTIGESESALEEWAKVEKKLKSKGVAGATELRSVLALMMDEETVERWVENETAGTTTALFRATASLFGGAEPEE